VGVVVETITTNRRTKMSNNTRIECSNCFLLISIPEWSNKEQNEFLYGGKIGADYCRKCVREFIQNEIEDGYRNPDGTKIIGK
jgi:hypothetical protein